MYSDSEVPQAWSFFHAAISSSRTLLSASLKDKSFTPATSQSCCHSDGVKRTENATISSNFRSGFCACRTIAAMAFCFTCGIVLPALNQPLTVLRLTPSNEASSALLIPANSVADLRRWFTSFISHSIPKKRLLSKGESNLRAEVSTLFANGCICRTNAHKKQTFSLTRANEMHTIAPNNPKVCRPSHFPFPPMNSLPRSPKPAPKGGRFVKW